MNAPGKNTAADYQAYADQGYSQATTASLLGVSREAVRLMANKYSIVFQSGRANVDRDDEMIRLHDEGKSQTQIAAELQCNSSSVFQACRRMGISRNKHPRKSKWEAPVRALAAQGMTVGEVAAALGIGQPAVSRIKSALAIPFARDGRAA